MAGKLSRPIKILWRVSLNGAAVGAWFAFAWLLRAPSEAESAVFFGYSFERMFLAGLVFLPAILFSYLSFRNLRSGVWLQHKAHQFTNWISTSPRFWTLTPSAIAVFTLFWLLAFVPQGRAALFIGPYSLYLARLAPLSLYGLLLSTFALVLILVSRFGLNTDFLLTAPDFLRLGLLLFGVFLAIWSLITLTGLGLGFDATVWNAPGTPILSSQVLICLATATLMLLATLYLKNHFAKRWSDLKLDLAIAGLIWLCASILWLRQPAAPTYYSSEPRPPNYESYPLSDAFNHDVIANNVLIGEGFRFGGAVAIRRPAYVQFLAGLETVLGSGVDRVVAGQVVILALFPALLYLQAAYLHNRLSGILLAGLITLRELNAIALGDVINTSHSKLLMADLPTALAMAAFGLAAIIWLRGSGRNPVLSLLAGGLLGWFVLLRSQVLTLIPFFALLALLVWGLRVAWKQVLLFVLGALLVVSPWILRNRILIGQWAIEDAGVAGFIATRYSFEPGTFALPFLPGESEGQYYARHMQSVRDFALQNPGYVAGFVADNYVRNLLLTVMPLPLTLQMRDLETHVRELPYWPSWDGRLESETFLPLLGNLFLVGLGIAVAWKQYRWVGLVPLVINLAFTVNLALARVSGWRYNLPTDWTMIFYYVLGLSQLVMWILFALSDNRKIHKFADNTVPLSKKADVSQKSKTAFPIQKFVLALIVLLVFGNSFLIIEALSRPRYHELSAEEAVDVLSDATVSNDQVSQAESLVSLLNSGNINYVNGRALYPSFYRAGEGDAERGFALVAPMEFDRITFYLIGPTPTSVALHVDDPDAAFPSGSDVLVLYCSGNSLHAAAVVIESGNSSMLLISPDLETSCPGEQMNNINISLLQLSFVSKYIGDLSK